jgi:hypothetical protein
LRLSRAGAGVGGETAVWSILFAAVGVVGAIGIVAILAYVVVANARSAMVGTNTPASTSAGNPSGPQIEVQSTNGLQSVANSGVTYSITQVQRQASIGGTYPVDRSDTEFVVLDVSAFNLDKTSHAIEPADFTLRDGAGRQYSVSTAAEAAMAASGDGTAFTGSSPLAGSSASVLALIYEVPIGGSALTLDVQNESTGGKVVALSVSS